MDHSPVAPTPIVNALSVDVEDWFQVGAFEGVIDRDDWDGLSLRVENNVLRILEMFAEANVTATFFTLGWVAKRHGPLMRRIVDAGHELASHGYDHTRVFTLSREEFAADLRKARCILEDASGVAINGYRAPSFSIDQRTPWAYRELVEQGYAYSSSVAPVAHDHYGWREAPRFAFKPLPWSDLVELPVTTAILGGRRVAAGGGGFFRVLPYAFSRWAIRQVNRREGRPAVFYFHPWEIDTDQPRVPEAPIRSRLRHYTRLQAMAPKLCDLVQRIRLGSDGPDRLSRSGGCVVFRASALERGGGMNAPFCNRTASITEANLSDRDEVAALEAFVEEEGGSLFHRPAWLRAVETGTGQEARGLVAQHGGAVVGWLPFTLCHSPLFGRAMISSGFGVGGGVLAAHTATAMALCEAAQHLAYRLSCDTIELRGGTVAEGWNTVTDSHCGFVRDLADDDEAQLLAIPRKQRAEIRKSLKQDFQVSIGSSKDDRAAHYEVYAQSVHNLGTPVFPRRLFDAMGDTFRETSDILTVRHGDIPVASVLSFYHDGAVMPYWGGGTRAARHLRANERMYFELMLHARRRNMQRFDFGRSKSGSGPYAYKKNWGFSSRPLEYAYWTQPGGKPRDLNPANDAYATKIAVWKRLPLSVANRLGPHIAKGLA